MVGDIGCGGLKMSKITKVNMGFSTAAKQLPDNHNVTVSNAISVTGVSTEVTLSDVDNILLFLKRLIKLNESCATVDVNRRQRIAVETIAGTTLGASVTGLSSGAGVATTNYPTAAAPQNYASTSYWLPVWAGPIDQRYIQKDQARNTYAEGVRRNLVIS